MPSAYENYAFDEPTEYSIAFRDWEEGFNAVFIMDEIT